MQINLPSLHIFLTRLEYIFHFFEKTQLSPICFIHIIFKKTYFIYMYVYHTYSTVLRFGIADGCKPHNVEAERQTQVLCQGSLGSEKPSHFSTFVFSSCKANSTCLYLAHPKLPVWCSNPLYPLQFSNLSHPHLAQC